MTTFQAPVYVQAAWQPGGQCQGLQQWEIPETIIIIIPYFDDMLKYISDFGC